TKETLQERDQNILGILTAEDFLEGEVDARVDESHGGGSVDREERLNRSCHSFYPGRLPSATIFFAISLIEMAKVNGPKPLSCLWHVFERHWTPTVLSPLTPMMQRLSISLMNAIPAGQQN
ncbi:MAG: hypothetical protein H7834_13800, partial [Magnetococcus sp. YQC-9]